MKKAIIVMGLIFLWLPFVFLQDFFPFLRFGMFAEPVRYESQYERFVVLYQDSGQVWRVFDPQSIHLSPAHWDLLWRNAYYKGQAPAKLRLFVQSQPVGGRRWELLRILEKKQIPKTNFGNYRKDS